MVIVMPEKMMALRPAQSVVGGKFRPAPTLCSRTTVEEGGFGPQLGAKRVHFTAPWLLLISSTVGRGRAHHHPRRCRFT